MANELLASVENKLRAAIAAHDLDEATLLVNVYGQLVEAEFKAHSGNTTALCEIHKRADELFRWAGRMALIIRQTASVQLGRLGVGTIYLAEAVRRESVRVRA